MYGMIDVLRERPDMKAQVWVVGESDDWLEAAFSDEAAARAYCDGKTGPHWWVKQLPLDPPKDAA